MDDTNTHLQPSRCPAICHKLWSSDLSGTLQAVLSPPGLTATFLICLSPDRQSTPGSRTLTAVAWRNPLPYSMCHRAPILPHLAHASGSAQVNNPARAELKQLEARPLGVQTASTRGNLAHSVRRDHKTRPSERAGDAT